MSGGQQESEFGITHELHGGVLRFYATQNLEQEKNRLEKFNCPSEFRTVYLDSFR